MNSLVKKVSIGLVWALPAMAFAQGDLGDAFTTVQNLITTVTSIVVGLVFIYFLWGLMQYLLGDEKVKEAARTKMIISVLIMFVLFSIWGIINLLQGTFGVTDPTAPTIELPTVTGRGASSGSGGLTQR